MWDLNYDEMSKTKLLTIFNRFISFTWTLVLWHWNINQIIDTYLEWFSIPLGLQTILVR